MRLFRADLVPVLAIVFGGAVGALTTGVALLARFDSVPPDPIVAPTSTAQASMLPPLVYIEGTRITSDPGVPPLEAWLRGETAFTASAVRSALTQWIAVTGTSPLLIHGLQEIEVLRPEEAVPRYGDEAAGGAILISLSWEDPGPDPPAGPDTSVEPMATPYTVGPHILNTEEARRAMFAAFPASVRDGGVGGTTTVDLFIDEHGEVQDTRIAQSSGHEAVDEAALTVASMLRFSAALNGDQPVSAWVSHPITFAMR